ncbi:MAG: amidohydrolase family protein, partial [Gemmatimonadales bacterium]
MGQCRRDPPRAHRLVGGDTLPPGLIGPGTKVVDGVIEARTAALLAPYLDRRGDPGTPNYRAAELDSLVAALDREGFLIHVHAIGDRAIRMALDAFDSVSANPAPARGRRHRIEHLETTDPADIPRFGLLGVI